MGNAHLISDLMLNVVPHVTFIKSCIMADVQHFIFISSGGTVYGIPKEKPISENHPTEPLNSYGLGKLVVEHYLKMLSRGTRLGFTTLRVSNPFGPGQTSQKGQGLIPAVLKQFAAGSSVNVLGNGQSERDYIYIEDVIDAIVTCLEHEPLNDVFNIGSGHGRTVLQVVNAIEHLLGRKIERQFVNHVPPTLRPMCSISRKRNRLSDGSLGRISMRHFGSRLRPMDLRRCREEPDTCPRERLRSMRLSVANRWLFAWQLALWTSMRSTCTQSSG